MFVLKEFFESFNQTMIEFNIKLTIKGQIEYSTGTLSPGNFDKEKVEKEYRKCLVAKDYRFCNTVLTFENNNKFIITSK
jgi:hypothetical protein